LVAAVAEEVALMGGSARYASIGADSPRETALAVWKHFLEVNREVLALEEHLLQPTPKNTRARVLGRLMHYWYDATKVVFADLGIERWDEAMVDIYRSAVEQIDENPLAAEFLRMRNIPEEKAK
jgi:hypothetical protein